MSTANSNNTFFRYLLCTTSGDNDVIAVSVYGQCYRLHVEGQQGRKRR